MSTNRCFPTLGELVKLLYNSSSILADRTNPSKHNSIKSTQKKIQRLSNEEGDLSTYLEELLTQYVSFMHDEFPQREVIYAWRQVLSELLNLYHHIIKTEATYLNKEDNIKWFIDTGLITALSESVSKNYFSFNIRLEKLKYPDSKFWYLPIISRDNIILPLVTVLKWIYKETNNTQTSFHRPSGFEDDHNCQCNLSNARKWCNGTIPRSWSDISKNMHYSFDKLRLEGSNLSRTLINNYMLILHISYLTTKVCTYILKHYNDEYLINILIKYKEYTTLYMKEYKDVYSRYLEFKYRNAIPLSNNEEKQLLFDFFQENKYRKQFRTQQFYSELTREKLNDGSKIKMWSNKYGESIVKKQIEYHNYILNMNSPVELGEILSLSHDIRTEFSQSKYNKFIKLVNRNNLDTNLAWLVLWTQAEKEFSHNNLFEAYNLFKDSVTQAKYCAGRMQFTLINRYIFVCAKINKFSEFKKMYYWSQYIGIDIKILRNFDINSNDDLKDAYNFYKKIGSG